MRYLLLGNMFNLRIRERFLTTRARELWNIFPVNINKTTKKFPPLSEKFLKEVMLYIVETLGIWEHSYVLMKYNCLQEPPNTDFKPVVLFVNILLITLMAIRPVTQILCKAFQ